MKTDLTIEISVGLLDHPKVLDLSRRLGRDSVPHLLRLWCWTRRHKPDGDLAGVDGAALAQIVAAPGSPPDLGVIDVMVEAGWIDGPPGARKVHDWADHQPRAVHSKERSEHARRAALARYAAPSMLGASSEHARLLGAAVEQCSSPLPSPPPGSPTLSPAPPLLPSPSPSLPTPPHAPLLPMGESAPAAEKAPTEAPPTRPRRPQRRAGDAMIARWEPQIAKAIRAFREASSAHGQRWPIGGEVERRLAAYFQRHGSDDRVQGALRRLTATPPRAWYVEEGPWSLAWLAASTDSNRQAVDRFQEILDGAFDEKGPGGTTVEDELKRLRGADYRPPAQREGTEGGTP